MKKTFVLLFMFLLTVVLTACGLPSLEDIANQLPDTDRIEDGFNNEDDYGNEDYDEEDEEDEEDYGQYDDYGDGVDGSNSSDPDNDSQEENSLPTGWWSKPYHLKAYLNDYGISKDDNKEVNIYYDGKELLVLEQDGNGYYCRIKNDALKIHVLDGESNFLVKTDRTDIMDEMINDMAYIRLIISYSYLPLQEQEDNPTPWEKSGSESINGFSCDVYKQTFPLISETTVWIDKDTGVLVRRENKHLTEDAEEEYGVHYEIISFNNTNAPEISSIFDLNTYGGDPEELADTLAKKCPLPESGTIVDESKTTYYYYITMEWTKEDTLAYTARLASLGFDQDVSETDYEIVYMYVAANSEGHKITVQWSDTNEGSINYYIE